MSDEFKLDRKLIIALDVNSGEVALDLVGQLAGRVGAFKIGPRLCLKYGETLSLKLAEYAPFPGDLPPKGPGPCRSRRCRRITRS